MKERRFRVEVTTTLAFFVDATSEADAIAGAIAAIEHGARPAYKCEPSVVAEVCAEAA